MDAERVPLPRLTSRSAVGWAVGTLVVLVVSLAVLAAVQPSYGVPAAVVAVLAVLAAVVVSTRRLWLEPAEGRLVVQRLGVLRRSAGLGDARSVALVDNRGGGLNLTVVPASGRAVVVPVLLLSDYVQASQPPGLLRLLADQVETHADRSAVPAVLRAQADHLGAGGTAADSPFAGLVSRGVLRAVGGKSGGGGSVPPG